MVESEKLKSEDMMVIVNFLGHSGFTVESETNFLIFDYYIGTLPELPKDKSVTVFVSHSHFDHFNRDIFSLRESRVDVRYVLSYDIPGKIPASFGVDDAVFAVPDQDITIDSKLKFRTLPSTDQGLAYLVNTDGKNIFHAGDLNLWLWESMTEAEAYEMTKTFENYTKRLSGRVIHTAFLPLDTRLGTYSCLAFNYYMTKFRIQHAVPMHLFGPDRIVTEFLQDPVSKPYRSKVIPMRPGDQENIQ